MVPTAFSFQEQLLPQKNSTLRSKLRNPANTKDDWVRGSDGAA